MGRIGELDLPDRLAPYAPAWVTQLTLALLIMGGAAVLRTVVDHFAPGVAPFAIGFPAILIATLFGRLLAGLVAMVLTIAYQWYFALSPTHTFQLATIEDRNRVIVAIGCYLAVVAIAELYRRTIRQAADERDRQIAERDLFLEEFDHRVKNNFTLVAALLDLQRRRAGEGETADALANALARVESIARAHRHLYRGNAGPGAVDMAAYLHELCTALSDALLLRGTVTLDCYADNAELPRDRAVSIGLIINELVTNAAKHAFTDTASGTIQVRFVTHGSGWRLTVSDNGLGMPSETQTRGRPGGLGQRLIDAFARQARSTIHVDSGAKGTTVTLDLAA